MAYSIYENISENQVSFVNAFAAPIENSAFHWHAEYEMLGVLEGEISLRTASEIITMKKNDVLLVNPNVVHSIQSVEEQENLCIIVQIRPELFRIGENDECDLCFYLNSTSGEISKELSAHFFRSMAGIVYETLSDEKYAPFRARAKTCQLIADLYEKVIHDMHFKNVNTQNNQELMIHVVDFMERRLEDENVVEDACHEFGLSRKTLDRNMKMVVGITVKEVLNDLRMERAKNLLKNTDNNMNYIIDNCGFGSEKTFYRVFRNETGFTPKEFREKGLIEKKSNILQGYLDVETFRVQSILKKIAKELC